MLEDPFNTKSHEDLELLVLRWSAESHTFVVASGEFGPTLEDVLNITALPLYGETNTMGLILEGEDEDKLQSLTAAIHHSKAASSNKFTNSSWIHYLDEG